MTQERQVYKPLNIINSMVMSQMIGKLPLLNKRERLVNDIFVENEENLSRDIEKIQDRLENLKKIWFKTSLTFAEIKTMERILDFKEKSLKALKKLKEIEVDYD